jgi:hypothetical protein
MIERSRTFTDASAAPAGRTQQRPSTVAARNEVAGAGRPTFLVNVDFMGRGFGTLGK